MNIQPRFLYVLWTLSPAVGPNILNMSMSLYKTGFDHDKFWVWAKELSKRCTVFVSEYTAPDWAEVVWEKKVTSSLTKDTGGKVAVEKLYKIMDA